MANDSVITQQKLKEYHETYVYPFLNGISTKGDQAFVPCGKIEGFMRTTAPKGYLVCDGTEYLKSAYPSLAALLASVDTAQSTTNFAGSDSDHFKVPDLRGEFLRGTGTNSHTNSVLGATEGSGSNVGVHQQATAHRYYQVEFDNGVFGFTNNAGNAVNHDGQKVSGKMKYSTTFTNQTPDPPTGGNYPCYFTARPTNTSVLYCIAYQDLYLTPGHTYSTDEQVVGTWIDSKPVYEKTITATSASTSDGNWQFSQVNISGWNIDSVVDIHCMGQTTTGVWMTLDSMIISNTGYIIKVVIDNDKANFTIWCNGSAFSETTIYATIQYTKTTD